MSCTSKSILLFVFGKTQETEFGCLVVREKLPDRDSCAHSCTTSSALVAHSSLIHPSYFNQKQTAPKKHTEQNRTERNGTFG